MVLVMGEGDIGVFLSLVWAAPDPDTLCGPSSGFTRFPLQGESEGRGRGTWLYNRWGRGACVARVESVMENTLCTVQMEEGSTRGG